MRKLLPVLVLTLLSMNVSAEIDNHTVELTSDADQVFIDSEEAEEGSYTDITVPYISSGDALGLVSYGELININYNEDEKSIFQITQESGSVLIPNTLNSFETIERRSNELRDRTLLEKINPSFGFSIPEQNIVRIVYNPDHTLTLEDDSLGSKQEIQLHHKGLLDGEINIGIKIN